MQTFSLVSAVVAFERIYSSTGFDYVCFTTFVSYKIRKQFFALYANRFQLDFDFDFQCKLERTIFRVISSVPQRER